MCFSNYFSTHGSGALSTFTLLSNPVSPEHSHLAELDSADTLTPHPHPSPWQPPFYILSWNLMTFSTSYKWNYAVLFFLWLAYLTQHNVIKFHPRCNMRQNLLPLLKWKWKCESLSHVRLSATLWPVARQAPLSMGFSRQEYWRRLSLPSPGDLPTQGLNLGVLHCRWILCLLSHQGRMILCCVDGPQFVCLSFTSWRALGVSTFCLLWIRIPVLLNWVWFINWPALNT